MPDLLRDARSSLLSARQVSGAEYATVELGFGIEFVDEQRGTRGVLEVAHGRLGREPNVVETVNSVRLCGQRFDLRITGVPRAGSQWHVMFFFEVDDAPVGAAPPPPPVLPAGTAAEAFVVLLLPADVCLMWLFAGIIFVAVPAAL